MNLKKQFGYPAKRGPLSAGFTLIELLVVVLIIGILSSVALPKYQKAVDRSKGVEALTFGKAIADAENVYFMANGHYEASIQNQDFSSLHIDMPNSEDWYIGTGGHSCNCESVSPDGGCHSSGCAFHVLDVGSRYNNIALFYYLKNGQTVCRCCSGEKCQNFFGVDNGEKLP